MRLQSRWMITFAGTVLAGFAAALPAQEPQQPKDPSAARIERLIDMLGRDDLTPKERKDMQGQLKKLRAELAQLRGKQDRGEPQARSPQDVRQLLEHLAESHRAAADGVEKTTPSALGVIMADPDLQNRLSEVTKALHEAKLQDHLKLAEGDLARANAQVDRLNRDLVTTTERAAKLADEAQAGALQHLHQDLARVQEETQARLGAARAELRARTQEPVAGLQDAGEASAPQEPEQTKAGLIAAARRLASAAKAAEQAGDLERQRDLLQAMERLHTDVIDRTARAAAAALRAVDHDAVRQEWSNRRQVEQVENVQKAEQRAQELAVKAETEAVDARDKALARMKLLARSEEFFRQRAEGELGAARRSFEEARKSAEEVRVLAAKRARDLQAQRSTGRARMRAQDPEPATAAPVSDDELRELIREVRAEMAQIRKLVQQIQRRAEARARQDGASTLPALDMPALDMMDPRVPPPPSPFAAPRAAMAPAPAAPPKPARTRRVRAPAVPDVSRENPFLAPVPAIAPIEVVELQGGARELDEHEIIRLPIIHTTELPVPPSIEVIEVPMPVEVFEAPAPPIPPVPPIQQPRGR